MKGEALRNFISEYMTRAKNDQIHPFATAFGVDKGLLRSFMQLKVTEAYINELGRFDKLETTVDRITANVFLEAHEVAANKPFQDNMKIDEVLRRFILEGGFDF